MKRDLQWIKLFVFVVVFSMFTIAPLLTESATAEDKGFGIFTGEAKSVNCATGEIKVTGKGGEQIFSLGKDVQFKGIKSCEEIVIGERVLIHYSEVDGKNVITSLKSRPERDVSKVQAKREKMNIFMGWVNSVDCEKALINVEHIEDRSKVETFSFSSDTTYDLPRGIKGCGDLKKGLTVALSYYEKDGKKFVKKVKKMLEKGR